MFISLSVIKTMQNKLKKSLNTTPKKHKQIKKTKNYARVYLPYLPMLMIIISGLLINIRMSQPNKGGVLAYATEISSQNLLKYSNERRQVNGAGNLAINNNLTQAAQTKANDMAKRNYWSHATPDGEQPWKFIQNAGYDYQKAGENLAYGFDSSYDTINGWMNSKTHKDNMLDKAYTEVGFGYANIANFNNTGPETVVVAMYGQPQSNVASKIPSESGQYGFNSSNGLAEPASLSVSRIQSLTNGPGSWATFAVGIFAGLSLFWVAYRYGKAIKKAVILGEEFALNHPLIDTAVVAIVVLGWLLIQTSGAIK